MRTVVLWDGVPGAATGEVRSLRNTKQPARTSENQTNVRSAGRQTIAITTLLNMALASRLEPLYATQPTRNGEAFPHLLGTRGARAGPSRAERSMVRSGSASIMRACIMRACALGQRRQAAHIQPKMLFPLQSNRCCRHRGCAALSRSRLAGVYHEPFRAGESRVLDGCNRSFKAPGSPHRHSSAIGPR